MICHLCRNPIGPEDDITTVAGPLESPPVVHVHTECWAADDQEGENQ